MRDTKFDAQLRVLGLDPVTAAEMGRMVRFYGIRAGLKALEQICDYYAEKNTELFNTVQAKQWAKWASLLAIVQKLDLTDPGRE